MRTQNIGFNEDLTKIIVLVPSNTVDSEMFART